ncbi:MAG TPA: PilZ domain-containing protein [Candidatus Bathyarchaeia archaeon]|nr:PilZ domain-containing protein [Candidatus Bathyarchaeia archaeon]
MDQRRFPRVPFRGSLDFGAAGAQDFQGTTGFDLSSGGVRMRSQEFIPLGDPVRVRFQLSEDKMVVLTGKVAWIQKEPQGEYYQMGIEFEENPSNLLPRRSIQDYIQD